MTKIALRSAALRTIAVCILGILVAPAIAECAGWSSSRADRHACCRNRGKMASETSMTNCCAMSDQSNQTATPETQLARTPLTLLGPHVVQAAVWAFSSRTLLLGESSWSRRAAVIPLYLQQAPLLI